jgi:hypothetical protein
VKALSKLSTDEQKIVDVCRARWPSFKVEEVPRIEGIAPGQFFEAQIGASYHENGKSYELTFTDPSDPGRARLARKTFFEAISRQAIRS